MAETRKVTGEITESGPAGVLAERRWAMRVSLLYGALVGLWVFLQSDLPLALLGDTGISRLTLLQTLTGWFFVLASAWLLYLLIDRHLSALREGDAALRLRDRAIESSVNAVVITDRRAPDGPIIYVNPAFERITGYAAAEALGRNPRFLQKDDVNQAGVQALRAAIERERPAHAVVRNYRRDGVMFWNDLHIAPVRDEAGRVTHYVGIQNDITEAKRYEEALGYHASHDALTRLPNRILLEDRLRQALVHGERYNKMVALALFNLDNFSLVNESLGRAAGDRVLIEFAHRIATCVRTLDTPARLAGDEFALVSFEHDGMDSVSAELQRVLETLSRPFQVDGREIVVTLSAGVAVSPQDGDGAEELLRNANAAMQRAKDQGRSSIQFYAPDMNRSVGERFELSSRLRHALERGELLLHYQPQVDLRNGRVVGAEALVRWREPELGMVPPVKFIPLAEETGLIVPVGEWVLRTACAQARQWQDGGLPPVRVAVNLSARQFRRKELVDDVARILRDAGIEARYLELELTESMVMHDPAGAIVLLQRLRDMGVQLSIDDFGTGYSSLSYLKRFPVDRLKIDQSFVSDVTSDENDAAIARAVISLAHNLKLKVTAEGVETREQLEFLRAAGCDEKQGYYFSKPLAADELTQLLQEGRTLAL